MYQEKGHFVYEADASIEFRVFALYKEAKKEGIPEKNEAERVWASLLATSCLDGGGFRVKKLSSEAVDHEIVSDSSSHSPQIEVKCQVDLCIVYRASGSERVKYDQRRQKSKRHAVFIPRYTNQTEKRGYERRMLARQVKRIHCSPLLSLLKAMNRCGTIDLEFGATVLMDTHNLIVKKAPLTPTTQPGQSEGDGRKQHRGGLHVINAWSQGIESKEGRVSILPHPPSSK